MPSANRTQLVQVATNLKPHFTNRYGSVDGEKDQICSLSNSIQRALSTWEGTLEKLGVFKINHP